mgnify:CR=1 FL=1
MWLRRCWLITCRFPGRGRHRCRFVQVGVVRAHRRVDHLDGHQHLQLWPSVAEVVVDGETGYVVSRDQERGALAAALAERAAALLSDPGLRARMGAVGARRVRAPLGKTVQIVRTLDLAPPGLPADVEQRLLVRLGLTAAR